MATIPSDADDSYKSTGATDPEGDTILVPRATGYDPDTLPSDDGSSIEGRYAQLRAAAEAGVTDPFPVDGQPS